LPIEGCRDIRNNNCDLKIAESASLGSSKSRVQPREESEIKNRESAEQAFSEIRVPANYSMKFPKPKQLVENEYPDLDMTQPELIKHFVQNIVFPTENSLMDKYIYQTIVALKNAKQEKAKEKAQKKKGKNSVSVNVSDLGSELFFTKCHIGATNSLMHTSVAHRLNIEYKPLKIGISTATGVDNDAVKGISHIRFKLKATDGREIICCANFIISSRLNGLEAILGNEFLLKNENIDSIKLDSIRIKNGDEIVSVPLVSDSKVSQGDKNHRGTITERLDISCKNCGKTGIIENMHIDTTKTIEVSHSVWEVEREELPEDEDIEIVDIRAFTHTL
jgi:hypothetical protein